VKAGRKPKRWKNPAACFPRRIALTARGPYLFWAEVFHEKSAEVPYWSLTGGFVVDPRLKIAQIKYEIKFGPDDAGNLWVPPNGSAPFSSGTSRPNNTGVALHTRLTHPENQGKTLSKITLNAKVLFEASSAAVEVEEADKKLRQQIKVGSATLTIAKLSANDSSISYEFHQSGADPVIFSFKIYDADGKIRGGGNINATSSGTFTHPDSTIRTPLRLHLEAPDSTFSSDVSMELHDLPLPPPPKQNP